MDGKKIGGSGTFNTYEDVIAFWVKQTSDKTGHKGVGLKREKNSTINLQFVDPATGKRINKACGEKFTERGILAAKDKAIKVANALNTFTSASQFWDWYDSTILAKNVLDKDLKTYQEIFAEIENNYFNGYHRNTGRSRSRDIVSDVNSFEGSYGRYFKRFPDKGKYLEWEDFEKALYGYPETPQGSKTFKDLLFVCKQIATLANAQKILERLGKINGKQTAFRVCQSIDLDTFLSLYDKVENAALNCVKCNESEAKLSWNWCAAMAVMYGLRPSELAAAKNLTTPCTITVDAKGLLVYLAEYSPLKGDAFYAISDNRNKDLALVLSDFTYFGASIKTGGRVCYPIPSPKLQVQLKLREPRLPLVDCARPGVFCEVFTSWTERNYGIKEAYVFRHLYNAIAQQYGIPQETRALNLGHTVAANERHYKGRNKRNLKTRKLLLTAKHPLPYEAAKSELELLGVDLQAPDVQLLLRTIYQLE
ncbi:hypothetical protein BCD67_24735 [Oscillatoriales cyanobacterium USR001]|nr:hypothetical protein BCD67_24735 [Oscillatoriales cyanobacterium USR001]